MVRIGVNMLDIGIIDRLRQKLEAAEAEIKDLKQAVRESDADIEAYKKVIREAQEQKPTSFILRSNGEEYAVNLSCDPYVFLENRKDIEIIPQFSSPVPAMPIQDNNEEKSIKLNARRYDFLRSIGGISYSLTTNGNKVKATGEIYDHLVDEEMNELEVKPS